MRLSRLLPAAAAGVLAATSLAPAQAQTADAAGTGTTTGSLTVLSARAGDLLALDLLSDRGLANTDGAVGAPAALASIAALAIDSPAAGVSQTVPLVSIESNGERKEQSTEVQPIDNPAVSGSIVPMALSAVVGSDGALSGLSAGVTDLDVLSGVLHLSSTDLGLDSEALTGQADGLRGAKVDALSALDLDSLLAGLGIPLTALPLDTVVGLVDSLGLLPQLGASLADAGVPGLDLQSLSADGILAAADTVTGDIGLLSGLQQQLSTDASSCDVAGPALDLLGQLTGQATESLCDNVPQTVDDAAAQILALTDQLGALLDAPVNVLSGQSLLALDGLDVSVVTKATDSLETSAADITAALGGIRVGNLGLDGFDAGATVDQVNAAIDQVEGTIGGVLGTIDPRLADLIDISALDRNTSVVEDAGSIVASADFTGLRIDVLPDLSELTSIIDGLVGVESIGDQLTGLGLPVPAAPAGITQVSSLLAGVPTSGLATDDAVSVLSEGLTIEVAGLSQQSSFTPAAPGQPATPTLPMTGSNAGLLLLLGGGAVLAALGTRHLLRRS